MWLTSRGGLGSHFTFFSTHKKPERRAPGWGHKAEWIRCRGHWQLLKGFVNILCIFTFLRGTQQKGTLCRLEEWITPFQQCMTFLTWALLQSDSSYSRMLHFNTVFPLYIHVETPQLAMAYSGKTLKMNSLVNSTFTYIETVILSRTITEVGILVIKTIFMTRSLTPVVKGWALASNRWVFKFWKLPRASLMHP